MKKYLFTLAFLVLAASAFAQQPVRLFDRLDEDNDAVRAYGSDDGGTTKRIIKTDSGGAVQVDIESAPTLQVQSNSANLATQTTAAAIQTAVELIDDAVHASDAALSKGIVVFCQFDDTSPGSTTENSVRPIRCSTRREVYTQIRDAAGNERGANVNASNQLSVSVDNSLSVTANAGTNLNTSSLLTTSAHDAAFGTAGSADAQVRTVQGVASMTPIQVSHLSAVQKYIDPCEREATSVAIIDQTSGEQLATGTASERIYVCSLNIVTASAQNIALVSGTGSVCATSTGAMMGGTTAGTGWNLAANGGIVLPATGKKYAFTDTDADNVCLLQSGSGQISGTMTYVSATNGL